MSDQQEFFSTDQDPSPAFDPGLLSLARRLGLGTGLRMGTSSWAFPGWVGLVYDRSYSPQILSRRGLTAYAQHPLFSTVSLDRTYYGPMSVGDLQSYAAQVPPGFEFQPKAWKTLTSPVDQGQRNDAFLDPQLANQAVLRPLYEGLGASLGPIVWQFSALALGRVGGISGFLAQLDTFLGGLSFGLSHAVEVRNPQLCGPQLRDLLARHGAHYVLNLMPNMPTLDEQFKRLSLQDHEQIIVRWLLAPGWEYQKAKAQFAPFDTLRCPDPQTRARLVAMIQWARREKKLVRLTVNNKAEGCAPASIEQLALALSQDRSDDAGAL